MPKQEALASEISEDLSEPSEQDNDSEESVEERFIPKVDRNLNYEPDFNHVTMNVAFTNYPVVKEVARSLGIRVIDDKDEINWDLCWTDYPITPQTFIRMHFHQSINYIPGIHTIARKNELGKRLNLMGSKEPNDYNFHPMTWMLPEEFSQLRRYMEGPGKGSTYIVKPEAACQGRGIYLVNRLQQIAIGRHCVVQKYIDNPLLLQRYKFDLRIYVLIGSIDPLRIYIFNDGLARFATQTYSTAHKGNFKSHYQHLTNYAINKLNPKFKASQSGAEEDTGFKRSLKAVFKALSESGIDTNQLWQKIQEIAVKTIILGYQKIKNNYVSSQPEEYHNHMAFHILGLDIFINEDLEPFLLQVNHTPSFATETFLDTKLKTNLIKDTLILMKAHDAELKHELFNKSKLYSHKRIENGIRQTFNLEQRTSLVQEQVKKRQEYQKDKMGGYKLIYPSSSQKKDKKYQNLINKAVTILEKKKANRKQSMLSQCELQKEQKEKEREKEKEKEKEKEREREKLKERLTLKDKKIQITKIKAQSIKTQRQRETKLHQTLTDFLKNELTVVKEEQLAHSSLINTENPYSKPKPSKHFSIKTKYSIPDVHLKPSIKSVDPTVPDKKKELNKLRIEVNSHLKGTFIKPRIYDVNSLAVTNYVPEEQRMVRKKNKDGRFIFHFAKP